MSKVWRKCGHPRTPENTAGVRPSHPGGECRACRLARQARYDQSQKGRARHARYARSEKRRAAQERYAGSEKALTKQARYDRSEKGRAAKARYARSEKAVQPRSATSALARAVADERVTLRRTFSRWPGAYANICS